MCWDPVNLLAYSKAQFRLKRATAYIYETNPGEGDCKENRTTVWLTGGENFSKKLAL